MVSLEVLTILSCIGLALGALGQTDLDTLIFGFVIVLKVCKALVALADGAVRHVRVGFHRRCTDLAFVA